MFYPADFHMDVLKVRKTYNKSNSELTIPIYKHYARFESNNRNRSNTKIGVFFICCFYSIRKLNRKVEKIVLRKQELGSGLANTLKMLLQ